MTITDNQLRAAIEQMEFAPKISEKGYSRKEYEMHCGEYTIFADIAADFYPGIGSPADPNSTDEYFDVSVKQIKMLNSDMQEIDLTESQIQMVRLEVENATIPAL